MNKQILDTFQFPRSNATRRRAIYAVIGLLAFALIYIYQLFYSDPYGLRWKKSCNEYCLKEFGTLGISEQIDKNQRTKSTSYQGPWNCTCEVK